MTAVKPRRLRITEPGGTPRGAPSPVVVGTTTSPSRVSGPADSDADGGAASGSDDARVRNGTEYAGVSPIWSKAIPTIVSEPTAVLAATPTGGVTVGPKGYGGCWSAPTSFRVTSLTSGVVAVGGTMAGTLPCRAGSPTTPVVSIVAPDGVAAGRATLGAAPLVVSRPGLAMALRNGAPSSSVVTGPGPTPAPEDGVEGPGVLANAPAALRLEVASAITLGVITLDRIWEPGRSLDGG